MFMAFQDSLKSLAIHFVGGSGFGGMWNDTTPQGWTALSWRLHTVARWHRPSHRRHGYQLGCVV